MTLLRDRAHYARICTGFHAAANAGQGAVVHPTDCAFHRQEVIIRVALIYKRVFFV